MSYPAGHEPSVNDGINGLLEQIARDMQELAGGTGGALTDTQLRASAVPVTQTGAATEAKQDTQITHLSQIEAAVEGATPAGNNNIGDVDVASVKGATNLVTSQVTAGAVATLVSARATRRSVLIRNNGTGTDEIAVGEATVTTTHGTRLKAGESCAFTFVGLIQVLAITGTPIVTAADEYD